MSLQDIVNISITRESRAVSRAGFGTALFLSASADFDEAIRVYSNLNAVKADFISSDDVYKMALAYFGQDVKPQKLIVGKRTAKVAQVLTITPTAVNLAVYTVTVNGTEYAYTADADATAGEIALGLIALVNADSNAVVTASGTTTLILTADVAGTPFTYSVETNLVAVLTTPSNGVIEDIALAQAENDDWYKLILASRNEGDIMNAAAVIETQRKVFAACTEDSAVKSAATTCVASKLKAKAYVRTYLFWSDDQENFPEAGIEGLICPKDPGSYTYDLKTIRGITASDLTDTEKTNLKAKNTNYYILEGGVNIFMNGGVIGEAEWIDTIIFIDWLQARMTERIFATLISVDKVPFTDAGIGIIENDVRAQLSEGIRVGGLAADPAPIVSVPKAADVDSADKLARVLNSVTFNATLAGAIHKVEVTGSVSV